MNVYENDSSPQQLLNKLGDSWVVDRVELDGGIKMYIQGAEFPRRGLPTPEASAAINVVKGLLLEFLRLLSLPRFWGSLYPTRYFLNQLSGSFNSVTRKVMSGYILKDEYLTDLTLELRAVLTTLLTNLKLDEPEETANTLAHIVEYDGAYRFRFLDLLTETTKEELIKWPIFEVMWLRKLNAERELAPYARERISRILLGLAFLLLFPKIRKSFIMAIANSDFTKLQFDANDRYWAAFCTDYNYHGLTYEERQQWLKDKGYKIPNAHHQTKEGSPED